MLSGCSSAEISRTSAQNRASVSPGSEAEVSMMMAMASIPSECIEGR